MVGVYPLPHTHLERAKRSPFRRRQRLYNLVFSFLTVFDVVLDLLLRSIHDRAVPTIEPGTASEHPSRRERVAG